MSEKLRPMNADKIISGLRNADPNSCKGCFMVPYCRETSECMAHYTADALEDFLERAERTGRWIFDEIHSGKNRVKVVCSNCTHYQTLKRGLYESQGVNWRYCPNCGAHMIGGEDDATD